MKGRKYLDATRPKTIGTERGLATHLTSAGSSLSLANEQDGESAELLFGRDGAVMAGALVILPPEAQVGLIRGHVFLGCSWRGG